MQTVDMDKALGKPHSLWCAFAKFYERHGDVPNARVIWDKATKVQFKYVDDLAQVRGTHAGDHVLGETECTSCLRSALVKHDLFSGV